MLEVWNNEGRICWFTRQILHACLCKATRRLNMKSPRERAEQVPYILVMRTAGARLA
jgi:hypothetical protein